jgi:hypothetical protein
MNRSSSWLTALFVWLPFLSVSGQQAGGKGVTVPFVLDHNRMLVEAEIQRSDGTWRKAKLWVDTGNPDFFMSDTLARDLGIDLSSATGNFETTAPVVRIGGLPLDFDGVKAQVMFQPFWLFSAMHNDANLPATVLRKYQVVFDYPNSQLAIAEPGAIPPRGIRIPAAVNPQTGIVQIDVTIDQGSLSFALDNGASYSFMSDDVLASLREKHPDWPHLTGSLGCANMWGWWPQDEQLTVARLPQIVTGPVSLTTVGMVGVPKLAPNGPTLGAWYSQKAARPVVGFLGPNAFKNFRVEIDYANSAVYFEKGTESDAHDMDMVGLTLRPEANGFYTVIGVAKINEKNAVEGVEIGDILVRVGALEVNGATMGTVIDALRGKPGDTRTLVLERQGKSFTATATVMRFL